MTTDNENRPIFLPPMPPARPATPQPVGDVEDIEDEIEDENAEGELVERPPINKKSDNYIPELGLSEKDEEEIFGTGEMSDGSIDEMERTDTDDVLTLGDEDSIFGTGEPKKKKRFKRTAKKYQPPASPSFGGMQY